MAAEPTPQPDPVKPADQGPPTSPPVDPPPLAQAGRGLGSTTNLPDRRDPITGSKSLRYPASFKVDIQMGCHERAMRI